MELNISAQAAARLAPLLRADRVLILDLNDGIGLIHGRITIQRKLNSVC